MHSLNQMADYATFSDSVDEIKLAYQTGKTLYTAVSRNHLGSVVSLGADCLKSYFGASESPVLQEISNAWNTATDTYSAAKNSILLGSSIGMFPLVIDLRNGIVNDLKKQVKAAYFIGDYYIAQEEPALYQLIFGEDGFLHSTSYFASQTTDLNQILFWKGLGMQYDVSQYSNVTRNWVRLLASTRAVDYFDDLKEQEESIVLRREFSNYVLILRTAASFGVPISSKCWNVEIIRRFPRFSGYLCCNHRMTILLLDEDIYLVQGRFVVWREGAQRLLVDFTDKFIKNAHALTKILGAVTDDFCIRW